VKARLLTTWTQSSVSSDCPPIVSWEALLPNETGALYHKARRLSIHILIKTVPSVIASYVKRLDVRKKQETLSDFVKRIRIEKNLSLSNVHRRSGGQIAGSYVSRIENGYILNVTPKKLRALAKGLGVSEDQIFAIARGLEKESLGAEAELAALLQKFQTLKKEDRDDLRVLIEVVDREIDRRMS